MPDRRPQAKAPRRYYKFLRVRFALELAGVWLALLIVSWLPLQALRVLGSLCGSVIYYLLPQRRDVGLRNLRLAFPELHQQQRQEILRRSYRRLGKTIGELVACTRLHRERICDLVNYDPACSDNFDAYLAATQRGQGAILFTGHICNWELLALGHALHGHPVMLLVRELDNPGVDRLLQAARSRGGNVILGNENESLADILDHLRQGGTVGLLVDQYPKRSRGVAVDFFGTRAWTNRGPALLALRTGALLFPTFLREDPTRAGHYVLRMGKPVSAERTGKYGEDIRRVSQALQQALEDEVRAEPAQWLWIHRRWKHSPDAAHVYPVSRRRRTRAQQRRSRSAHVQQH